MNDFLVLGTDTDAGKTTFALLWLTLFADRYAYWKPVETGAADSANVRHLVAAAQVHGSVVHLDEPVAPPLAGRFHQRPIPTARTLAGKKPPCDKALLIETFGSPFSPLNEEELQIALVLALACPSVLISSSALGTIGRTLQCLVALEAHGHLPQAVVLVGAPDDFALEKIRQHRPTIPAFSLAAPQAWTPAGIAQTAANQAAVLRSIREALKGAAEAKTDCQDILARDRRHLWHPYTSLREADPPLVCVGAQNEFLHLADGRRVIDGISSWWTILHGHRFPPLMQALGQAAQQFDHVHFAGVTHAPAVALAELLLSTAPWKNRPPSRLAGEEEGVRDGGRVFFSDNGSTAVEVALKMAYQFWCHHGEPGRRRFVGFEHGYHGDTFGAMAVGRDPVFFGRFEPLLFQADILPLNPARLEEHLRQRGPETAALIVEPLVQGAGGMHMHEPEVLRAIFDVAKRHGVLFIADEVMTGGGRLGTLWAHQQANIAPDLICAAKTLAGGVLPLAATLAAPHVVVAWDTDDRTRTFFHGHSFTAHPLACAVALANWRALTANCPEAPRRMHLFWQEALQPLARQPQVKEVRISGSIAAIELKDEGGYLSDMGRRLRHKCLQKDVLLRPLGNVLYAMPPLRTSAESLQKIAQAMIAAVQDI
jgi:adenosylmethionine-8-amino-7-oxononanoate aminotransferase